MSVGWSIGRLRRRSGPSQPFSTDVPISQSLGDPLAITSPPTHTTTIATTPAIHRHLHPRTPTAKPTPADYTEEVGQILAALAPGEGPLSGQAWARLAALTDTVRKGGRHGGREGWVDR